MHQVTDLGDVGKSTGTAKTYAAKSAFGQNNGDTGNHADGNGATANAVIVLTHPRGQHIDETKADGSGNWDFYDLDDATYYASEVGSTKAWSVAVNGTSVTVTALSGGGGGGTVAHGYVG